VFELIQNYDDFVWVASDDEYAILSQKALQRAKRRFAGKVKLRKPVMKTISGESHLFTDNEWLRATEFALEFQIRCAQCERHNLHRYEKNDRHNHQMKRQKSYEIKIQNQAKSFAITSLNYQR